MPRRRGRGEDLEREETGETAEGAKLETLTLQLFEELLMAARVGEFLADKAPGLLQQHRVFDLVEVLLDRLDDEGFTVGNGHRVGVEPMG